jgi:hypothetical protein
MATINGTNGDDTLNGTNSADQIDGNDGNDTINAGDGNDCVDGGNGNDVIDGGAGDDSIQGGAGDDILVAGDGTDHVYGGTGNDDITGGGDDDNLIGGADADTFHVDSVATVGCEPCGYPGSNNTFVDGGSAGDDNDTLDITAMIDSGWTVEHMNLTPEHNGNDGYDGSINLYNAGLDQWSTVNFQDIEHFTGVVPCFTPGTRIATPKGEVAVETLRPGDKVVTRDNGLQEIRWVGRKELHGPELAMNRNLRPVLIRAGALGRGLPERDMLVSPNHRMLIMGERPALYFDEREVFAAAKHMVDGTRIQRLDSTAVTYIHFMFDHHEVVLSDGTWSESFQPGDYAINGVGDAARRELMDLFPELEHAAGRAEYGAARRVLKRHEAGMLAI